MNPFPLTIICPWGEGRQYSANLVTVPGEAADYGLMAQHAPCIIGLKPGTVRIYTSAESAAQATHPDEVLQVQWGHMVFSRNTCTIFLTAS